MIIYVQKEKEYQVSILNKLRLRALSEEKDSVIPIVFLWNELDF